MTPYKVAGQLGQTPGYRRPAECQGSRGAVQVPHHQHVRQGGQGHAGGGRRRSGPRPSSRRSTSERLGRLFASASTCTRRAVAPQGWPRLERRGLVDMASQRARRRRAATRRRRARQRLLEDERWLAFVLLVPTMVLLGLFIAYPFVRGILLSVTNSRVGVPGDFVGLANFYKIWNDPIFRTAVCNTFLYTAVTTVFKLALGLWLAHAAQPQLQGQGLHPRLHPAALHHPDGAVDLRLEVDVRSDLQRAQLAALSTSAPSPAASTGSAIPTSPCSRSSSSTSGAACRSSPSACWPACRPSAPS